MKTLNRIQLIGYLGSDPVIHKFENGSVVAKLNLATNYLLRNKETKTIWHDVKIWGEDRVNHIQNNLVKGSHVMVEGSLEYNCFVNNAGTQMMKAEINALYFMNLDR